jgi:hypothetical protein
MKRYRSGSTSDSRVYHQQLLQAIGKFLPRRGLSLISKDKRVRWTDRLLVSMAMLMAWQPAVCLADAFEECWQTLVGMYPTRRRAGHSHEGFSKALMQRGGRLLALVVAALRKAVKEVAGKYWLIEGYIVMGVDGSRINCPRTATNEQAFGCAGKPGTGPQQFVTTLLHVGTGLIWSWRRGGGQQAERTHLREMMADMPTGSLLLADAGFTGYDLLRALLAAGHCFIIRAGSHVRLLKKLGFAVREHQDTVYLWPQDRRDQEPLVLRLVALADGRRTVYLLTSILQQSQLSDDQIGRMYRRRWGLELFYRSLKRTMQKHTVRSKAAAQAQMELDWALAGLWMLGLLTVEQMVAQGVDPQQWSVAESLRSIRRVMSARGGRMQARGLRVLGLALKDSYHRRSSKTRQHWPRQKQESPPKKPKMRIAQECEKQAAKRFREKTEAA